MSVFLQLLAWSVALVEAMSLHVFYLTLLCVVAVILSAVIAPIGALRWWAGFGARRRSSDKSGSVIDIRAPAASGPAPTHCIVYLSGIGDISGQYTKPMEQQFLDRIAAALPGSILIDDVFPFSVTNEGMTEEHVLGKFWMWLHNSEVNRTRFAALGQLVNLRNVLQVAVSVDKRYGPIYGWGTASTILESLLRHGYPFGSHMPVSFIGYSGGGQISLGSARYLHATLRAPIQLVSLGGVMDSDPGIEALVRLTHLFGSKDSVQRIGDYVFVNRWPIRSQSLWNQGLRDGKITRVELGPMTHHGAESYFDNECRLPSGESFLDHTTETVVKLIREFGAQPEPAGPARSAAGGPAHV